MSRFEMYEGKHRIVGDWHEWFAWRPVFTYDIGWVWLKKVERQYTRMSDNKWAKKFVYYRRLGSRSFED